MLTYGEEVAYSRPHTEQKVDHVDPRSTLHPHQLSSTVWAMQAGSNDPRVTYHRVGYAVSVWFKQSQSCSDLCVHILPGGLG